MVMSLDCIRSDLTVGLTIYGATESRLSTSRNSGACPPLNAILHRKPVLTGLELFSLNELFTKKKGKSQKQAYLAGYRGTSRSSIEEPAGSAEEESFLDSVRHQFANRRWVRTTRGSSRRLVKIENLERLSESDPKIMANNASHRGTRNPLYDEDNEESTGFNHELNPTAPINQQLSNKAVSRQLVEIAQMLAQLTLQVAIEKTLAARATQRTNPPSTTPTQGTQIHNYKANQE
ncbi:hypothetical protein TEA_019291 [Camellia sinensis var. sinensis]|uniref:Uncharacterized protein n=1 Tax=Camellia sinensis var. sinensis TaxID=542762 RepID=A0A4S4EFM4_CAMSN|nr:hypothetical protein TEA_019291 [Camellia sinensis var. sinensis]